MADIKVHYASFPYHEITTSGGAITIKTSAFQVLGEMITGDAIASLEICTENSVKKIGGALGWGVVGGALIGPAGIIVGALLGGNKNEVTFVSELKDGRKFMGTTEHQSYTALTASKLKFDHILNSSPQEDEIEYTPTHDEEMMTKAIRMYSEPDYMAWKERMGEAGDIRAWMSRVGYYPPGYQK